MRPWAAMRRKGFCIDSLWRYFGFRAMFCDRLKSEEVTPGACNTHPNVLCCKLEQATLQPTTYTRDRTEGHVFPGVRLNRNRRKLNSVASSIQIMDGMGKSIPLARAPHDQIRFGFSSFAQVRRLRLTSTTLSCTKSLTVIRCDASVHRGRSGYFRYLLGCRAPQS